MRSVLSKTAWITLAALTLGACDTVTNSGRTAFPETRPQAFIPDRTQTQTLLSALPAPDRPVAVAVYGFSDQTGQFKPVEAGQTLSRAVSQGGGSILVKALQDAGNRQWFTIVERESLRNLLNERQIIREMRERYLGEQGVNPQALPALLFAGVLLEGGIVGYDSNTVTGGAGAAFLGIGGRSEYRQDTVTVYLRAVSVRTGEVLTTVTASKTIASQSVGANAFRYIAFKELLQAEIGYTTNEPDQVALQQAIEKAVYGLVLEGVDLKLWNFADTDAGWPLLWEYRQERDGKIDEAEMAEALRNAPPMAPQRIKRSVRGDEADGDRVLDRSQGGRLRN
ncbi:CsgG/HfaB family protein [Qipengyuania sp. DY56-A-20]|uniref:CsgG/HfaB family protein n=1 Tax=Qipengyuania benthica TaxID=3067651 RepID=A0ABT9H8E0_9SPHN|nr:CsgG/HfaB family protein [Qipengyuania sp. DY56-A-20]MDP4539140.1 CsgG/HfaB family protein [Qipengyuania sp. DY56-A-20]